MAKGGEDWWRYGHESVSEAGTVSTTETQPKWGLSDALV